jgi:hypothetical protein
MKQVALKAMDSTIGKMDQTIEVNFYQEWGMEEVSGRWLMVILMKVNTWMIKRMAKVSIFGKMVPSIKVIFRMTTVMATEKWNGKTAELIKGSG